MKIEKYVVVLVAENGDKRHLKMSVNRDGNSVEIHLPEGVDMGGGNIYLIGEEIAKQTLYNDKYNYKVRFCAKEHIEVAVCSGGKTYIGGTGKAPKHRDVKARILGYENALENVVKSSAFESDNGDEKHCQNSNIASSVVDGVRDVKEYDSCREKCAEKPAVKSMEKTVEKSVQNGSENEYDLGCKNTLEDMANPVGKNGLKNTDFQGQILSENVVQNSGAQKVDDHHNLDKDKQGVFAFESDMHGGQKESDRQTLQRDESKIFSFDTVRFDGNNFYLSVKPQLDEIFVCYPEDELLNTTVPNSRWVRIDTQDGYYVVGLVLDGDDVSYICYGVPSTDKTTPPAEIKDLAVWLSTAENNGKGYWIIYQDALTGKCLK